VTPSNSASPDPSARACAYTEHLRNAVLRVGALLPAKPAIPVLVGMKVSLLGDRIRFEAGDLESAGFMEVANLLPGCDPAVVLVRGTVLARVIRRAPQYAVTFTATPNELVLTADRWTTRLMSLPVEDYPDWSDLHTDPPPGQPDDRTYGNSALTAKPVPPDGRDRELRGTPAKVTLWEPPPRRPEPFQPKPFEAGDWLEYTDPAGQVRLGQVWSAASPRCPGTLLLTGPGDGRARARRFEVWQPTRAARSFYVIEEQPGQPDTTPQQIHCTLRRSRPPAEEVPADLLAA
jgi:hypothetical protein